MKLNEFSDKGVTKWRCNWIDPDTKKRRFKQFKTQQAGNLWIDNKKKIAESHGKTIAAEETSLLAQWTELDKLLRKKGGTLIRAGEIALKQWSAKGYSSVSDTLDEYIEDRKNAGRQSSTLSSTKGKVTRLLKAHKSINLLETPLREVSSSHIKEAIEARSKKITARGLEYERQRLRDFFSWCVKHELTAESPVPPKDSDAKISEKNKKKNIAIFTPIEARELLLEAHAYGHSNIMAWVVLGLFCGVRPDSTFRVWKTKEGGDRSLYEWKWGELLKAVKTGKLHIIDKVGERTQTLTPQALVWIRWLISNYGIQKADSPISGSNWMTTLRAFRAGWKKKHNIQRWPDDILRHTFGTYRMHTIETVAQLADEMGNSPTIIEKHYFRKGVDPEDVIDFWNLTPCIFDGDQIVDIQDFEQPREWHDTINHKVM